MADKRGGQVHVHQRNGSGLNKALIVHREEPVLTDGLDAMVKDCATAAVQLEIKAKDWGPDAWTEAGQPSTC